MKRILSVLCIGSMMLTLSTSSVFAEKPKSKNGGKDAHVTTHASGAASSRGAVMKGRNARVRHSATASRGYTARSSVRSRNRVTTPAYRTARSERGHVYRQNATVNRAAVNQRAMARQERVSRTGVTQRGTAVTTARQRSYASGAAWRGARNRNVQVVNTWRSNQFSGRAYAPFRDYTRVYHDRGWYHSHYGSSIVFVLGGWWYWNAGYWYPAWGYAPSAYYPYDGPIYTGYANLTPDRVVVQVQRQLARDGYYAGPIDGDIGPMTRQALAGFQADNGLAVTSAIDQPTLSMLGIS